MITIIDSLRYEEEHAPFNSSFIATITKAFPEEVSNIYTQKRHQHAITDILTKNKIDTSKLKFLRLKGISNKKSTINLLLSYFICTFHDTWLLIREKSELIFYTSANPFSLFFIKLFNTILNKRVFVVLHGELEYLNKSNDQALPIQTRVIRIWYRLIFWRLLSKNFKYIVLGGSILSNLKTLKSIGLPDRKFIIIDHPYFYQEMNNLKINFQILSLGIVGHASTIKGSHLIYELANTKKIEIINEKIKFRIIGHLSPCMSEYQNNQVSTQSTKGFMPRAEYESEISSLSYILFFYPESMYRFIASGALFDAISFEKPVIALRNSFFEHYFERFHDIGYLCDDIKEMSDYLSNFDSERYEQQINNIRKMKEELSIEKISNQLLSQIEFK